MRFLSVLLLMLTLSACVAVPLPKQLVAVPGVAIETLQTSVNISLTSSAGKLSGNGVLFYQRPDSFRLTILAPLGQSIFDIIVTSEKVIYLAESRKKGWQGGMQELPDWLGMKVWPLLKWVMEPPQPAGPSRERSFIRADGTVGKVYYDAAGFVQKKVNAFGDAVIYSDYRLADGIAVANRMEISTVAGSSLSLIFDEPEVNRPIDKEIFSPLLDRYEMLPLADFKGF